MLKADRLSGVMRWKVNFTESGFKGEANLAAWNGLWLDTSGVKSIQDFVDVAANQTSNPQLVAHTLAELIEKMFSSDTLDGSICVAWSGWQDLMKSAPAEALEIAEAFELGCQERSAVVLVCDSVGSFPGISELSQG
jgi:hypothetical protein